MEWLREERLSPAVKSYEENNFKTNNNATDLQVA